jgi:hypothetical protein
MLMQFFGKVIGVVVRGALKPNSWLGVVCSRKHHRQTVADRLTNDEATTYCHDISTGILHKAGFLKQSFKRSQRADDVVIRNQWLGMVLFVGL